MSFLLFFFNDTATTEIYTLSLHDALPIFVAEPAITWTVFQVIVWCLQPGVEAGIESTLSRSASVDSGFNAGRSEEHTSELQSRLHLVCRLLLEKKKTQHTPDEESNQQPTP